MSATVKLLSVQNLISRCEGAVLHYFGPATASGWEAHHFWEGIFRNGGSETVGECTDR